MLVSCQERFGLGLNPHNFIKCQRLSPYISSQ